MASPTGALLKAIRNASLGVKVDRATQALPQTTNYSLFTVTGGRVILTSIVGEVTTIIQTQLDNAKLISTPTVGTAVDMCAVLNITAKEAGCLFGITGLPADALVGTNAGLTTGMKQQLILPAGTIKLDCSASNTGAVKWTITYVPIDDGAWVEAA